MSAATDYLSTLKIASACRAVGRQVANNSSALVSGTTVAAAYLAQLNAEIAALQVQATALDAIVNPP